MTGRLLHFSLAPGHAAAAQPQGVGPLRWCLLGSCRLWHQERRQARRQDHGWRAPAPSRGRQPAACPPARFSYEDTLCGRHPSRPNCQGMCGPGGRFSCRITRVSLSHQPHLPRLAGLLRRRHARFDPLRQTTAAAAAPAHAWTVPSLSPPPCFHKATATSSLVCALPHTFA